MLGRLGFDSLPFYSAIAFGGASITVLGGLVVFLLVTYFGKWRYFWEEWLTSWIINALVSCTSPLHGDVGARLCGRADDALAAGHGVE